MSQPTHSSALILPKSQPSGARQEWSPHYSILADLMNPSQLPSLRIFLSFGLNFATMLANNLEKNMKTNKSHIDWYTERVAQLEAEGLCTSDAQSIVDIEEINKTIENVKQAREESLYQKRLAYLESIADPEDGETKLEKAKSDLQWHLEVMEGAYAMMAESGESIAHILRQEPKSELEVYENLFDLEGINIYEKPEMITEFN